MILKMGLRIILEIEFKMGLTMCLKITLKMAPKMSLKTGDKFQDEPQVGVSRLLLRWVSR